EYLMEEKKVSVTKETLKNAVIGFLFADHYYNVKLIDVISGKLDKNELLEMKDFLETEFGDEEAYGIINTVININLSGQSFYDKQGNLNPNIHKDFSNDEDDEDDEESHDKEFETEE